MKHSSHIQSVVAQGLLVLLLVAPLFAVALDTGREKSESAKLVDVVRDPSDVPPPVTRTSPAVVQVTLTAEEVLGTLDPSSNTTYRYWTFNGKLPGPMIRVRQGDTVELTLRNDGTSHMAHSIDLHAALGPGGGAALTQVMPGQTKTMTFQATTPGLFVYHCGTPMIAEHMANGMYGLILVEPEGGLPQVDHEYYVMQGEVYTTAPKGKEGLQQFSPAKLMAETPEYYVFNGAVDALMTGHVMKANVGETVRIFFGNAGPNQAAATHAVGEIFTKVYEDGTVTSPPLTNVQTAGVPPGAAAILEFAAKVPGNFALMDHSIARMSKGLMAAIKIAGQDDGTLMHAGMATPQQVTVAVAGHVSGITDADEAESQKPLAAADPAAATHAMGAMDKASMLHMGMSDMDAGKMEGIKHATHGTTASTMPRAAATGLNGCLTLAPDGRAILNAFQSAKKYRLEGHALLFSENGNRIVHVSGRFGSIMAMEDPNLPSFVVDTVDALAPTCTVNMTAAQMAKLVAKRTQTARDGKRVIGMSDMAFQPAMLEVNAGETVVWKNSSQVTHNVVGDPAKAVLPVDIKLPSGARPFASAMMMPGQTFSRTFDTPGVYRYVCTLHETAGMKGVIIVKGPQVLRASK